MGGCLICRPQYSRVACSWRGVCSSAVGGWCLHEPLTQRGQLCVCAQTRKTKRSTTRIVHSGASDGAPAAIAGAVEASGVVSHHPTERGLTRITQTGGLRTERRTPVTRLTTDLCAQVTVRHRRPGRSGGRRLFSRLLAATPRGGAAAAAAAARSTDGAMRQAFVAEQAAARAALGGIRCAFQRHWKRNERNTASLCCNCPPP